MIAYVSLVPIYLLGNLLLFVAVVCISALTRNRRIVGVVAVAAIVPSVVYWTAFSFETGVRRQMTFDMEWSHGERWERYPDADHIILRFKTHPNHFVGIVSRDLAKYLETLPSQDVRVVFEVTLDFGKTRGTCLARQTAKKPGFYATPTRNLTDLSQDKAQGSLYKLLE